MRLNNRKWNIWGRRITVLLLLCGLLLPVVPHADADTVIYEYKWITATTDLPTDSQWHDYFIAWEDVDDKNKYWFTDYHWYTADSYNNYDAGGSHWMEYRALSTLPDITSASFTSKDCMGHMQIKFAGIDKDNDNSPMYYIRVSKIHGGYVYFTSYEPTNSEDDADAFTFQDKGDVFHIFVNIGGKADRYLTRDGQNLETTESSSYGGGEYWRPLRVYRRTFTVDESGDELPDEVIGKRTLYEYNWVNTVAELNALTDTSKGAWIDIMLAWEDSDGSKNNAGKVWYTKEIWYDAANKVNYDNHGANEWWYYSNDYIGSDGYGSHDAEKFLLPHKASHFQMQFYDWDEDNRNYDPEYSKNDFPCPTFLFRFDIGRGQYIYIGNDEFSDQMSNAENYSVQMRMGKETDEDIALGDKKGSVWIFNNISREQDEYFCRGGNTMSIGNWYGSDYWEFPFRIYTLKEVEYDAIVKSFTVGKGATYAIDSNLILEKDVTITVEDGGVLTVDKQLLSDGNIVVNNGGTVIINEGGSIVGYGKSAERKILLDGGNLIIMDGGRLINDGHPCSLEASNGATILNRGLLVVGYVLAMESNSYLLNESGSMMLVGGVIPWERGGLSTLPFDEIAEGMYSRAFNYICGSGSKIVNKGTIIQPKDSFITKSTYFDSCLSNVDSGTVIIRQD